MAEVNRYKSVEGDRSASARVGSGADRAFASSPAWELDKPKPKPAPKSSDTED